MITRKIDVLIVDDEKFAREGFRNIIDWDRLGFRICAEASDAEDALDKIWMYQPGLVLLDAGCRTCSGPKFSGRHERPVTRGK